MPFDALLRPMLAAYGCLLVTFSFKITGFIMGFLTFVINAVWKHLVLGKMSVGTNVLADR